MAIKNIKNYAEKLLIKLENDEAKEIKSAIDKIDNQMNEIFLSNLIKNVEPQTHAIDLYEAKLREDDEMDNSDAIEDLFSNTKHYQGREIEVPKVIE